MDYQSAIGAALILYRTQLTLRKVFRQHALAKIVISTVVRYVSM